MKIKRFNETHDSDNTLGKFRFPAFKKLEDDIWGILGDDNTDEIQDIVESCEKLYDDIGFLGGDDASLICGFVSDDFKKLSKE